MFAQLGIHDPLRELTVRRFCSLIEGFILKDRTADQRKDMQAALEGRSSKTVDEATDSKLAEAYRSDGYSDQRIKMMEELRHEKDPVRRSQIRLRYMTAAKEAREQQGEG